MKKQVQESSQALNSARLERNRKSGSMAPQLISFLELTAFIEGFEHGDERLKKAFQALVRRCLSGVLKQMEDGDDVAELARELGVSEVTLYGWSSKYGGVDNHETHQLKDYEQLRRQFTSLIAQLNSHREGLKYLPAFPEAARP